MRDREQQSSELWKEMFLPVLMGNVLIAGGAVLGFCVLRYYRHWRFGEVVDQGLMSVLGDAFIAIWVTVLIGVFLAWVGVRAQIEGKCGNSP